MGTVSTGTTLPDPVPSTRVATRGLEETLAADALPIYRQTIDDRTEIVMRNTEGFHGRRMRGGFFGPGFPFGGPEFGGPGGFGPRGPGGPRLPGQTPGGPGSPPHGGPPGARPL